MAALIWIIVILCLANYVGRCGAEVLNGVCGKNKNYFPTPAERMEEKAEKREKRNENIWFWCILPIWIFAIYAFHTWG